MQNYSDIQITFLKKNHIEVSKNPESRTCFSDQQSSYVFGIGLVDTNFVFDLWICNIDHHHIGHQ